MKKQKQLLIKLDGMPVTPMKVDRTDVYRGDRIFVIRSGHLIELVVDDVTFIGNSKVVSASSV